jgi:hypothetical protein
VFPSAPECYPDISFWRYMRSYRPSGCMGMNTADPHAPTGTTATPPTAAPGVVTGRDDDAGFGEEEEEEEEEEDEDEDEDEAEEDEEEEEEAEEAE